MTKALTMKNAVTGETITEYCWAVTSQEVNRITSTALDGTVYVQVIGKPAKRIEVEGVISDDKLEALRAAEASATVMILSNDTETLYGRIVSLRERTRIVNCKRKFSAELTREVGA